MKIKEELWKGLNKNAYICGILVEGIVVFQGSSGFGWQESLAIVPVRKLYGLLIVVKISEIQTRQDVPRTNSRPGKLKGLLPFSAIIKG